jgi:rhodanese-related sulfurtransferase
MFQHSLILFFIASAVCAQGSIDRTLERLNKGSVDYISVEELGHGTGYFLLDTRKDEEYSVSHLKGALWVGYQQFSFDSVLQTIQDKQAPLVVYCSVGVRSEDIGEKLMTAGYTNVKNLYGGIFEWMNHGYPVYNMEGQETNMVHAYNKRWGKLLKVQDSNKVYGDQHLEVRPEDN